MRMMLRASMPSEVANRMVQEGTLGSTIERILHDLKPEAAYFAEENGERTAYIFFEMQQSSELVAIAEPWFLAFNSKITVRPAMNQQDLAAAGPHFQKAIAAYPKRASA